MSRCLILVCLLGCVYAAPAVNKPSPILFIPGLTSSPLNVQDSTNTECNTNGEIYNIWYNATHIRTAPQCFTSQLRLNYSDGYSDAPGVNITVPLFGSVMSVEFYLSKFLEYFVERGYTKDKDIRVAPYDWRLSPAQLNQRGFYTNLRLLIQTMYADNNNTRVTIVVHSMGGPVSLYFLTNIVSQEWKDMYIHSYVTLAGAWSGGNEIIVDLLSGPYDGSLAAMSVGIGELRSLYRTFPSFYLLLARPSVWNDTVLVSTPTRNYTANDFQQLFMDLGYSQGFTQFNEMGMTWPAPNVSTYCFYGLGVPTPMSYIYEDVFPDAEPTVVYGDGDDSVNKPSSEVCLRWANSGYPFNRTVFPGVDHSMIYNDRAVLDSIASIVGVTASGAIPISTLKLVHLVLMLLAVKLLV